MSRNDLCFCGSGIKQKKCHKGISEDSKWAQIYKANQLYDIFVEENGLGGKCPSNCSVCCDALFSVSAEDFYIILDYLCHGDLNLVENRIKKANQISEQFQKDYPHAWKNLCEDMPKTDMSHLDLKYWGESFNMNSNLPRCMFLSDEGKCEIYECRPGICREFGSTAECGILKNSTLLTDEVEKMYNAHNKITNKKGESIVKRPYPLFYWFSHFLEDDFKKEISTKKMSSIKSLSEDAYFRTHRI